MSAPSKIGKYEIRQQIGRGAMGVVYEAFDSVIERAVAIKMLRTDVFDAEQLPDVRARFKREANSAGRLSHPNIVTVFDYGEHEGTPYIAMDLMVGEELSRRVDSGARLPLPEVVRIMEQLLAALGYAHEAGVVHRDIKPANVYVLRDGTVKVVDFGLARVESSQLTETGAVLGTPAYMSPEQFLGLPVDARSDIFSAGVILYQLLTGDRPFTGSPTTIMQKVLSQQPIEPTLLNPTLAPAWNLVVSRALAKKPDERFQSARQFAELVRLVHEGRTDDATIPIDLTIERTIKLPPPRRATRALPIALAALAVIALVGIGAWLYRPAPPAFVPPVASLPAPEPTAEKVEKKPVPKPKPVAKVEKRAEKPTPPPPPARAAAQPAAQPSVQPRGKVVSLDRNWGFVVVEFPGAGNIRLGDRLYANLADGRRVEMVVRRISGNLVSAIPDGKKLSDDLVGAPVTQK